MTGLIEETDSDASGTARDVSCPYCGALAGFDCFDRRYSSKPHLTPVPTKHFHEMRIGKWERRYGMRERFDG